ncbi:NAD(P)-binding protein [Coniophora puteana RWD-64-598 SS2]|uniref:NAD(P)-binding protein n=1 Tax=Coniophora puteana (strain RWD-64-598) TaxID=741705 RepID=A0A5M3M9F1_CONPW|nr:NAD(P)-binding protein [Coniophora puteana RWD-64-598 SS2]EIW75868.1 NAD(P)-binding protein [Coniophora puteana RWD-64-598 SS2]
MASPRIWFITGASSGFGRCMTELLLRNGEIAIATLRKPSMLSDLVAQYPASQLLVLELDVTKKSDVAAAFTKAKDTFGRIDVVFNNAGIMALGEVEAMDDENARQMFEVNFWGASHVTKEALKFFREVNKPIGGRLLQVSSGAGVGASPGNGYYSATKFALEGLTEAAIKEVDPSWNIKITIVEPGPFRTRIMNENVKIVDPHPAYSDPEMAGTKFKKYITGPASGDTEKAVRVIDRLSRLEDPPVRLPLHSLVLQRTRDKIKSFAETVDEYGSWCDDLYFD